MGKRREVPAGKQRLRVADGVYLKANGKYLATYRDPRRKQRWKEFRTQREAEAWRASSRDGSGPPGGSRGPRPHPVAVQVLPRDLRGTRGHTGVSERGQSAEGAVAAEGTRTAHVGRVLASSLAHMTGTARDLPGRRG